MNTLAFRINHKSYIFQADGEDLPHKFGVEGIPYYYFSEAVLPSAAEPSFILLGVCSCGTEGCGSLTASMQRENGMVRLIPQFVPEDLQEGWRFSEENVDAVLTEIWADITRTYPNYLVELESERCRLTP